MFNVFVWTACDLMCVLFPGLCFVFLLWSCCLCVFAFVIVGCVCVWDVLCDVVWFV